MDGVILSLRRIQREAGMTNGMLSGLPTLDRS